MGLSPVFRIEPSRLSVKFCWIRSTMYMATQAVVASEDVKLDTTRVN